MHMLPGLAGLLKYRRGKFREQTKQQFYNQHTTPVRK